MRLFGKVDSAINAFDRADFLTPPFDKTEATPPVPPAGVASPHTYRRPQETFEYYRRQFGQEDIP